MGCSTYLIGSKISLQGGYTVVYLVFTIESYCIPPLHAYFPYFERSSWLHFCYKKYSKCLLTFCAGFEKWPIFKYDCFGHKLGNFWRKLCYLKCQNRVTLAPAASTMIGKCVIKWSSSK